MPIEKKNEPDQNPEQYSFLQEKIKNETVDKKKLMYRIFKLFGRGLIFGIAASIGFFALKPWGETSFQKNPDKVTIPKDEEPVNNHNAAVEKTEGQQVLTVKHQKQLADALRQVAREAEKSMVDVIGVHENSDWTMENPDENSAAGVIVADNGQELLILTNTSVLKGAKSVNVKFVDGVQYAATVKKQTSNIQMAILGVQKNSIQDTTWSEIKVARLGNSKALLRGETLIALGEPFSYANGMGIGVASSVDHNTVLADGVYNILVTNMAGTKRSSGALFDLYGNVMGIIHPDFFVGEDSGVLTAFGISSIKNEIELMSNAKDVPYLGIRGTMVTEEIAKAHNIPVGLYVIEVEADSPAMTAGIQAGDIITNIDQKTIESMTVYHDTVLAEEVGNQLTLKGQRRGAEDYVEIGFTVVVGRK